MVLSISGSAADAAWLWHVPSAPASCGKPAPLGKLSMVAKASMIAQLCAIAQVSRIALPSRNCQMTEIAAFRSHHLHR
jgi:uncharacterized NAD-dependent epimerase/dehydratase family protein